MVDVTKVIMGNGRCMWLRWAHLFLLQRAKPSMQEQASPAPSADDVSHEH